MRRTIVTTASMNHFGALKNFVNSYNVAETGRVVVYDMSLDEAARVEIGTWPDVELRIFNFSAYPPHFRVEVNSGQYAWKAAMVVGASAADLALSDGVATQTWRETTAVSCHGRTPATTYGGRCATRGGWAPNGAPTRSGPSSTPTPSSTPACSSSSRSPRPSRPATRACAAARCASQGRARSVGLRRRTATSSTPSCRSRS